MHGWPDGRHQVHYPCHTQLTSHRSFSVGSTRLCGQRANLARIILVQCQCCLSAGWPSSTIVRGPKKAHSKPTLYHPYSVGLAWANMVLTWVGLRSYCTAPASKTAWIRRRPTAQCPCGPTQLDRAGPVQYLCSTHTVSSTGYGIWPGMPRLIIDLPCSAIITAHY